MTFTGFTETSKLPFKGGDVVVIPAGTRVSTMHPSRSSYVTKRKQTIKVHHTLNGMSMNPGFCKRKDIELACEGRGIDVNEHYFNWEYLLLEADEAADPEARKEILRKHNGYQIPVYGPAVCWPGAGGYWCQVDINDIV